MGMRHPCRRSVEGSTRLALQAHVVACAQTPAEEEFASDVRKCLDCRAAMLQAISVVRRIPMLEPWIIDEIRRREVERRRGDRPQLELPVPDPEWPQQGDPRDGNEQGDRGPERGVVIIGM